MKEIIRALKIFRGEWKAAAWAFFLLITGALVGLVKPWPLAFIIDHVLGDKPWPEWCRPVVGTMQTSGIVLALSFSIFAVYAVHAALNAAENIVLINTGLRGLARVRNTLFEKIQRLGLRFQRMIDSGDMIYRASWDVYSFQTLFHQGVFTFLSSAISLVLMSIVMWRINGYLTIAAWGVMPLMVFGFRYYGRRMSERSGVAQETDSRVTTLLHRFISIVPLTIAYLRESDTQRRFSESVGEAYSRRLAQHRAEVAYLLVVGVVFGLGTAVIAWLGVFEVKRGELSLGGLIVFVSYLSQLYEPLNRLSHLGTTVTGARAGVRRVFEILDTADEPVEGRAARGIALTQRDVKEGQRRRPLIFKGDIGFRNAGFGYNPGSRVLRDISFDVDSGDSVAVVGHNGAGKTTLLQMIPRFFDPDAGAVLFDGEDITGLKLADVRRVVAFAFQTPFVFPGTVAENIALGKPGALMDEIIEAAASAHAEDVIEKLPAGYDTVIGEAGVQFSAGEKQRLNLARLFLKDAPVLVIDEPVSALDAESAECVRAALKKLMPGRTVFLAAHDPVTVALARKVLVLNEGEMTYFGENTGSSIGLE